MARRKTETEAPKATDPRAEELARQQAVVDAVYDATHDKDGNPIPIIPTAPVTLGPK